LRSPYLLRHTNHQAGDNINILILDTGFQEDFKLRPNVMPGPLDRGRYVGK
jgi:hypothetical protein